MTISKSGTIAIVENLRSEGQTSRADYLEAMDARYWQMYEALQKFVRGYIDAPGDEMLENNPLGNAFESALAALDAAKGE